MSQMYLKTKPISQMDLKTKAIKALLRVGSWDLLEYQK